MARTLNQLHPFASRLRKLTLESLEQRLPFDSALPSLAWEVGSATAGAQAETPTFVHFASQEELKTALLEAAVKQYESKFGQPGSPYMYCAVCDYAGLSVGSSSAGLGSNVSLSSNLQTTSVQVAGIDEADVVETDGRYLYVLSHYNRDVAIFDSQGGEVATLVGSVSIEREDSLYTSIRGMYLHQGKLIIVGQNANYWGLSASGWYQPPQTVIATYDVTNPASAQLINRASLSGSYRDSRLVGDRLIVITQAWKQLPDPKLVPIDPNASPPVSVAGDGMASTADFLFIRENATHRFQTKEEYLATMSTEWEKYLPAFNVTGSDASQPLYDATSLFVNRLEDLSESLALVTVLDVSSGLDYLSSAAVALPTVDVVNMSADAVYLTSTQPPWWRNKESYNQNETTIIRFGVSAEGSLSSAVHGKILGHVSNQFWIDEWNGVLRVVTSDVEKQLLPVWDPVTGSLSFPRSSDELGVHLYVLRPNSDRLETVGEIPRFAVGEQAFSVRFFGEIAYVVTFPREDSENLRPIDPLFSISLADPTNPHIVGELQISGFSDHLIPIDDTHLLGIGREIDPETGINQGLQISVFDVGEWSQPKLVSRLRLRDTLEINPMDYFFRWRPWASIGHQSLAYLPNERLLSIPINWSRVFRWTNKSNSAFLLIRVGEDYSLMSEGHVPFVFSQLNESNERSVQIGEQIFYISQSAVQVANLSNPDDVRNVDLQLAEYSPPVLLPEYVESVPAAWENVSVAVGEADSEAEDLNEDATVDIRDILLGIFYFNQHAGKRTTEMPLGKPRRADVDFNGTLDIGDILKLISRFNRPAESATTTTNSPQSPANTATPSSDDPLAPLDPVTADIALLSFVPFGPRRRG